MNGLSAAVVAACAASLIGAVVSGFVTDGGIKKILGLVLGAFTICAMKKILGLVLGAFTICAMIVPVSRAASDFSVNIENHQSYGELTATADEACQKQLVNTTRQNLEVTLTAILNQNGIYPEKVEVILAFADENSIIISQVSIYISNSDISQTAKISQLTEQSFQIKPDIIRSEDE